ncbi:hypothetical protein BW731_05990 [Vagococcus martis]|uniref:Pesticidal crystal protein Cry1Aa domain-containing protein n=1 Tax=Vagococcus martis TaxID=1768210 RepID=A0A1V4DHH2_9ENTE|nr:toxin Cry1Ac domain D-VI-related protein [Vagococcus martis]OPF87766.1 hypothetical protein BW731_05990 [Vagococcus martis]
MEKRQDKKSSNIIVKLVILVAIVVGVIFGGRYILNDKQKSSTTTKTKETQVSTVNKESEQLQVALDAMKELFVNGDPTRYRTDVTKKEFSSVQDKIDKLEGSTVKENLQTKLDEIKKSQTGGSSGSSS